VSRRLTAGVVLLSIAWFVGTFPAGSTSPPAAFRVLVFSGTAGFRHDSIPAAVTAIEQLGAANGFAVDSTESTSMFADSTLQRYAVVMFLLTTGDVLDTDQQAAFTSYIEGGGAFVGVHSAADTEHDWPWYGGLVGAYFESHPAVQQATVEVIDREAPSTIHLPARWIRTDEWYNFQTDPGPSVTVLAELDEATYAPGDGAMGPSHPIAWQHIYDGGRSWYTGGGHTADSYSEPLFRKHLLGGILWAAGYDLPSFKSLEIRVVDQRLQVAASYPSCYRCLLQIRVWAGNRLQTTALDATGTRAVGLTPTLRPGRHRYSVTLTYRPMAAQVTSSGRVTVD
jgi:cytochrome c